MNRRHFLRSLTAGTAAAASWTARAASTPTFAEAHYGEPRRVGLIGSGWYGKTDLLRLIQVAPVEVVSLCDVDRRMLEDAANIVAVRQVSGTRPRLYDDYRDMLAEGDLDIVLVATPDHWHALPAIAAMKAGADVFVQKPISVDIVEGQAMLAAARNYGRVVQVGTQRRSTPHLIEARERYIKSGRLGEIGHVDTYCYYHMRTRKNPPPIAPPDHLDFDMWTGPAPLRPYNQVIHPRGWRNFMEYSNGIVGDMCIHMLDMVRWMLDLGWPNRVSSFGGIQVDTESIANTPDTQTATFDFGPMQVSWQHRTWGHPADPDYPWGATIYGDKGTLKLSVYAYDFIPTGEGRPEHGDVVYELDEHPEDRTEDDLERHVAPAIRRHMIDFLNAIDERSRPVADIEEGHISTASCILANISLALGRALEWDVQEGRVVADEEANRLLERPYREPWIHPDPDSV